MRDILRGPLKAAFIAGFTVGMLLFILNPPDLTGATGLLVFTGGAIVLALGTAWAFVALSGKDSMDDVDFERLIRRSEKLARHPELLAETTEFDLIVAEAIDRLPTDFQALLDETPVVVSRLGAENHAYGHYIGDTVARDNYPDRIIVYQDTLERDFGWNPELLRAQVERTLRHEIAHHLGWDERGVAELGL